MKPFNVTLIEPPGYAHSQALAEVQQYLVAILADCGFAVRASTNSIADNEHSILLCAHLLPAPVAAMLPPDAIIFNSEKLENVGSKLFAGGDYQRLIERHWVWDYSARNLARIPHQRTALIPLTSSPALRRDYPRNPDGPLLFYGVRTGYRLDLLDRLRRANVPVEVAPFGCYGEERDRMMCAAGAVLNLHTDEQHRIFEPVRCFFPLSNGIPVISQEFHDEPGFDLFRRSMFVVGDDLAGEVASLLANRRAFTAEAERRGQIFATGDPLPAVREAIARYLDTRG